MPYDQVEFRRMMAERPYGKALVCENGHVLSSNVVGEAGVVEKFCPSCGAQALTACPSCGDPIRGPRQGSPSFQAFYAPRYCHRCGKPHAWTAARLKALRDLAAEIEELSEGEREVLVDSFGDLSCETPNTEVAALRVRKILKKLGGGAGQALYNFIVDWASETAVKILRGG